MEQENRSFIHDTINLDEIRELLSGGDGAAPEEEMDQAWQEDHSVTQEEMTDAEPAPQEAEPDEASVLAEAVETNEDGAEQDPPAQPEDVTAAPLEAQEAVPAEEVTEGKGKPGRNKESLAVELYNMLHDVVYLLAAVTLVFVFVIRLVGVQGDSMLPTLHNRDYLLLESNFLYNGDDLKYGDIVVLQVPHYELRDEGPIVKRVIATEGQTVDIDFDTGVVYVNGVQLQETYVNTPTNYNWQGESGLEFPAVVPENCIFVLGDNRNDSMDSRYAPIGMIDERCVLGKVLLVALPGQTLDELGNAAEPRDWSRIGLVS